MGLFFSLTAKVCSGANATVISNGADLVDDGAIIAIGPADEINARYSAVETQSDDNRIVLPGLINGHSHAALTLLRGAADDMALIGWPTNYISPAKVASVDTEFVRIGTELACWEMIRGGTTTLPRVKLPASSKDMPFSKTAIAKADTASAGMLASANPATKESILVSVSWRPTRLCK